MEKEKATKLPEKIEKIMVYNQSFERIVLFYMNGVLRELLNEVDLIPVFSEEKSNIPINIQIVEGNIQQHTISGKFNLLHPKIPCVLRLNTEFTENTTDLNTLVTMSVEFLEQKFGKNTNYDRIINGVTKFIEYFIEFFNVYLKISPKFLKQTESCVIKGNRDSLYHFFESLQNIKLDQKVLLSVDGDNTDMFKEGNLIHFSAQSYNEKVTLMVTKRKNDPNSKMWTIKFKSISSNVKNQEGILHFIYINENTTCVIIKHIFNEPVTLKQLKEMKEQKLLLFRNMKKFVGEYEPDTNESGTELEESLDKEGEEDDTCKKSVSTNALKDGLNVNEENEEEEEEEEKEEGEEN